MPSLPLYHAKTRCLIGFLAHEAFHTAQMQDGSTYGYARRDRQYLAVQADAVKPVIDTQMAAFMLTDRCGVIVGLLPRADHLHHCNGFVLA